MNKIELSKEKQAELKEANTFVDYSKRGSSVRSSVDLSVRSSVNLNDKAAILQAVRSKNKLKQRPFISKQQAFMEFKADTFGKQIEGKISENR